MIVGACRLTLRLPTSHSLKDKRQIVRSIVERTRQRHNVSIAEVGMNDQWQMATIGISCVSNDGGRVDEILSTVLAYIEGSRPDVEVVERVVEIIPVTDY